MALEIAIHRFGSPEVLEPRVVPDSAPRPGELRIRHTAIGVNFTDVHGRRGDYAPLRAMPMPLILGMEAAGVVEALGEGVERFHEQAAKAHRLLESGATTGPLVLIP